MEHLERRLARVAALPPAERGPDLEALLESTALLREVERSLPWGGSDDSDGSSSGAVRALAPADRQAAPAEEAQETQLQLPGRPAPLDRRQVLLAFAKVARADYLCPHEPPLLQAARPALAVHLTRLLSMRPPPDTRVPQRPDLAAPDPAWEPLSEILEAYVGAAAIPYSAGSGTVTAAKLQTCLNVVDTLSDPACQSAVDAQLSLLGEGSGPPLLTARQLLHACCCQAADFALRLAWVDRPGPWGGLPAAQVAALNARMAGAAVQLLQLEPDSPKGLSLAANLQHL
ncbi:hypothetical protein ABPG75_010025 [Micractinium tetrahymenae]